MPGIDASKPFLPINIAVMTVSDTRTLDTDTSGQILVDRIKALGHRIAERVVVKDDVPTIVAKLRQWIADPAVDCVITTGGTGLTGRDVTPEAFKQVCEKEIPGFGELFRWISMKSIGTSTVQSRATAGVANGTYLFALPGSNGAVKDGWDEILKYQLDARHTPCNFVELMPRLKEHLGPKPKT
jgi:molybdenum cofactor biosynthesis protein B